MVIAAASATSAVTSKPAPPLLSVAVASCPDGPTCNDGCVPPGYGACYGGGCSCDLQTCIYSGYCKDGCPCAPGTASTTTNAVCDCQPCPDGTTSTGNSGQCTPTPIYKCAGGQCVGLGGKCGSGPTVYDI